MSADDREGQLRIGDWRFDPSTRQLLRGDTVEPLPLKVAEVLGLLAAQPGLVVSRETLIAQVWDGNSYTGPRGLTNAVWHLRRLLDSPDGKDSAIETIAKSGYRLTLPVQIVAGPPPPPAAPATRAPAWRVPALIAALVLAAVAGALMWKLRPAMPELQTAGRPEPLTVFDGMEEFPDISADGRWLAFTWEREERPSQIFARDLQQPDAPLRQLSLGSDSEVRPVWSPDAQRIAFARITPAGDCSVLIRDIDTFHERTIAPCFYERLHQILDWSPDGKTLAIARQDREAGSVAVYLHDLDGGPARQLTHPDQGAQDSQLTWSQDGTRLAFVRRTVNVGELYAVDLQGRETRLTSDGTGIFGLTWMADDAGIVFNSLRDGNFALWRIAADGGAPQLYSRIETPFNMTALPGGGIALSQHRTAEHIEVRGLADGALRSNISSGGRDLYAQWSPVLNRLLFVSTRGGRYELWNTDPDGNDARRLRTPTGSLAVPAWSPTDARYAITLRPADQRHDHLYIGDAAGDTLRAVIDDDHDYQNATWEADGRALLLSSNRGGTWELWRYRIENASFEQLTREGGQFAQRVGERLYHTRPGRPGLWQLRPGEQTPTIVIDELAVDDWANWRVRGNTLYYVARKPQHDEVRARTLADGREHVVLSLPRNAIRIYNSLSVSEDGRMALTILGRRQADIVALRPAP